MAAKRFTNARIPAKRVLTQAIGATGADVMVVGRDKAGDLYLASSMGSRNDDDKAALLALLRDASKRIRAMRFPLPTKAPQS
jgi:hypothetical protein